MKKKKKKKWESQYSFKTCVEGLIFLLAEKITFSISFLSNGLTSLQLHPVRTGWLLVPVVM